jgi:hypothetical protein
MEKSIVNIISVLLSMTLHADQTEVVPTAETTEHIKIKLENIVLEKNPWIGKAKNLNNTVRKTSNGKRMCYTV